MFAIRDKSKTEGPPSHSNRPSSKAWAVSLFVHAGLFVLLACFVLPQVVSNHLVMLAASRSDRLLPEFALAALDSSAEPIAVSESAESLVTLPLSTATMAAFDPRATLDFADRELSPEFDLLRDRSAPELLERERERMVPWDTRKPATTQSITTAFGVEAALGPIEKAIRDEMDQGDTLVVWLMDASISLQLNRVRVARRLAAFQSSLGLATRQEGLRSRDSNHRLFTSVVAFGNTVQEMQTPTLTGLKAVETIAKLPSDKTGVERTMFAVNYVVKKYRAKRRERMLIVLLTDESGDDGLAVEQTILNCRQNGVAVHVLGPTAVMGLEEGSQPWTAFADGKPYQFLLKVKRGPESCLPERAFLPYWHESPVSAWRPNVRPANSVPWYGGEYREGVLSGFGPYTLTRLALQTGGSYTLFDSSAEDRYDQESLREYYPEYGSLADYQASLQGRPLRLFVAEVAAVTLRESDTFLPLRMMFFGSRSSRYPFAPRSVYMPPHTFRRNLKESVKLERKKALLAAERIDAILAIYDERELEYEYAKEESLRWRAWFDLTRGRLLAASTRYREYIAVCDVLLQAKFNENVNEVMLLPSNRFNVPGSESTARQAVRYLEGCRDDNLGTPWSDLAAWELETAFGIQFRTQAIPRPPPPPTMTMGFKGSMGLRSSGGGGGQTFSFPSL